MAFFSKLESALTLDASSFIRGAKRAASSADNLAQESDEADQEVTDLGLSLGEVGATATTAIGPTLGAANAIDEAGDQATGTTGAFGALTLSTSGLAGSMGVLSTSIVSLTIAISGLMIVLSPLMATLSALAVGAAGLAAAFGAIIGTGLIAYNSKLTKQNKQRLKQVKKKIRQLERVKDKTGSLTKAQKKQLRQLKKTAKKLKDATKGFGALALKLKQVGKQIAPLIIQFGKKFIPLIKAALNALPTLIKSIINAIGPLNKFKKALRDLGAFAMVALPKVIGYIIDLGRWALPIFRKIGNYIIKYVIPALQSFIKAGQRLAPTFSKLVMGITRFLGTIKPAVSWVFKLSSAFWKLAASLASGKGIVRALKNIALVIKQGLKGAFRWISTVGVALARKALRTLSRKAVTAFKFGKKHLLPAIRHGFTATWRWVRTKGVMLARKALKRVSIFIKKIWRKIWKRLPKPVKRAILRVRKAISKFSKRFRKLFVLIRKSINQFITQAVKKFRRFSRLVKIAIRRPTKSFRRLRREILGILPSFTKLKTKAVTLADTIRAQVLPVLGGAGLIGVASTLAFIFKGPLLMALTGLATYLSGPLSKAFAGITRATGKFKWILGLLSGDVRKFGKYLRGVITRALGPLATILGRIRGYFIRFAGVLSGPVLSALSFVLSPVKRLGLLLAGPLIAALSSVGSAIFTLLPTIGTLGSTIALLANPITLIVGLIVGLAIAWKTNLWNMRKITKQVFSAIKALISGNMNLAEKRFSKAAGMINASWAKNIEPLIQSAKRIFNTIKRVVSDAMRWLITNAVKPILRSLRQLWQRHGQNIMKSVKELFNFLKGIFKVTLGALILIWQHFGDEILTVTKFIFDAVGSTIKAVLDAILTIFDAVTDFMAGEWEQGLTKLWNLAKRIFGGIIDFVVKWGSGFVKWIIDILADALDAFIQWGKDLIFGSVVTRILDAVIDAVISFGKDIIREIKLYFGKIVSYLKTQFWSDLTGAIDSAADEVFDRLHKLGVDVYNTVTNFFGDVINYFKTDFTDDIVSALDDAAHAAWKAFKNAFNTLIPDKIPIPSITVGGYDMPGPIPSIPSKTVGGGSIPLPSLDVGGRVTDTGLALVHEGETVVPASANKPYHGPDEQALTRAVAQAVVEGFSRVEIRGGDIYLDGEELTDSLLENLETRANRYSARQAGGGQ